MVTAVVDHDGEADGDVSLRYDRYELIINYSLCSNHKYKIDSIFILILITSPLNSFEQFDVVMPKKRLTSFGIAVTQER